MCRWVDASASTRPHPLSPTRRGLVYSRSGGKETEQRLGRSREDRLRLCVYVGVGGSTVAEERSSRSKEGPLILLSLRGVCVRSTWHWIEERRTKQRREPRSEASHVAALVLLCVWVRVWVWVWFGLGWIHRKQAAWDRPIFGLDLEMDLWSGRSNSQIDPSQTSIDARTHLAQTIFDFYCCFFWVCPDDEQGMGLPLNFESRATSSLPACFVDRIDFRLWLCLTYSSTVRPESLTSRPHTITGDSIDCPRRIGAGGGPRLLPRRARLLIDREAAPLAAPFGPS